MRVRVTDATWNGPVWRVDVDRCQKHRKMIKAGEEGDSFPSSEMELPWSLLVYL